MEKMSATRKSRTIFQSLGFLFYISRVMGIMPYSIGHFFREKKLRPSIVANIWCCIVLLNHTLLYHFATWSSSLEMGGSQSNTLTIVIGVFIIYMEPALMVTDIISMMVNQRDLIQCMERLQTVDEKLRKENIPLHYKRVVTLVNIILVVALACEIILISFNYFLFELTEDAIVASLSWFLTALPLMTNSVARVWYIALVCLVRQQFLAINEYFMHTQEVFLEIKLKYTDKKASSAEKSPKVEIVGYLDREILTKQRSTPEKPPQTTFPNPPIQVHPTQPATIRDTLLAFTVNEKNFSVGDKMDKKLILICRLHDEVCEIGKLVNKMFGFQMLITMAYGFMSITAQFYFLYCGLVGQKIPILFRNAQSLWISCIFIALTACKCISVIYVSWKTKTDAQKSGVHLHKIANVVDENHFYHVVNHLSLKLLNHHLNFTACGFFDLDMTTVYAITGAITSYLIILIQFNLAAQKTRSIANNGTSTNSSALNTTERP
ncbi:gustatory receptor for bitter taste 66a-like [Phlebotomus argentipes]|uniref:gustatory receptor for bitter taste 66a-like n=1 Tax=Phlebotomus argentipes TaxID=94469 RepID=UPI002892A1FC|nr:gustatory receptor for bitter taste 66a-like [Phlebotomus argentipes]